MLSFKNNNEKYKNLLGLIAMMGLVAIMNPLLGVQRQENKVDLLS